MTLPNAFAEKMRGLLGEGEAEEFFAALTESPRTSGLRCNALKIEPQALAKLLDIPLTPVAWCDLGFTYPSDTERRPSKNPLYHAGLYYLQEPSAMAPVVLLDPKPGERVLDLCAAPGGKAAQIAGALQGEGVLVANDASASRSRALVKNLCMCGVHNAVIMRETPERLAGRFGGYFDKILVDAPCSGEGMFRKDEGAVRAWDENKPEACVILQREILHHAARMVAPGGLIVYSTCTFDLRENEGQIADFLERCEDFHVEEIEHDKWGFARGFEPVPQAARLFPHKLNGEGHFVCLLRKKGSRDESLAAKSSAGAFWGRAHGFNLFKEFCSEYLVNDFNEVILKQYGSALYDVPGGVPDLGGLRVARSGWHLGEIKKDRFEPSHALALGLSAVDCRMVYDFGLDECVRYLRGESVDVGGVFGGKAWVLVCFLGYPLGWARFVGGRLKNKYPSGWLV